MRAFRFAMVVALAVVSGGCIRNRAIVTSEPPEAMVYWNNQYRGRTPIEIPFTFMWKYKVDVELEGYKKETHIEFLRTRPWFIAPLGFFGHLLPFRFTDTRHLRYALEKEELETP